MITCYLRYVIDPYKVQGFEPYGRMWIPLVNRLGAQPHGCHMRAQTTSRMPLFRFPSLVAYEEYRKKILDDPECRAAFDRADNTPSNAVSFGRFLTD